MIVYSFLREKKKKKGRDINGIINWEKLGLTPHLAKKKLKNSMFIWILKYFTKILGYLIQILGYSKYSIKLCLVPDWVILSNPIFL